MKKLFTLLTATSLMMGCFGVEPESDSKIVVTMNKVQGTAFAKTIANDVPETFSDTIDLDTVTNQVRLVYPIEQSQRYNILVNGALTCGTQVGANVTDDVTIDSLIVNTQIIDNGCVIEVDVKTDTLGYANRLADKLDWQGVYDLVGENIVYNGDSTLLYKLIWDTTYYEDISARLVRATNSNWWDGAKGDFEYTLNDTLFNYILDDTTKTNRHKILAIYFFTNNSLKGYPLYYDKNYKPSEYVMLKLHELLNSEKENFDSTGNLPIEIAMRDGNVTGLRYTNELNNYWTYGNWQSVIIQY
jgi:hypothetical protein